MSVGGQLRCEKVLDTAAFDRSASTDDVLQYVRHLMLGRLLLLISTCDHYSEGKEEFGLL